MTYEELGYMGRYLRNYKPRLTLHRITNSLFAQPPRQLLFPSAMVVQQKRFPDVSFYQGEIDFPVMRAKSDACVFRAGQNLWVDSRFKQNWIEAKRHGIKRGSYWFYDDRIDPGKQADLWVSLLVSDLPEMEIWCDWENSYGGAFGGLRNVVAFMQAMEARIPGFKIGLYTGYFWFREHSNAVTNAAQYNYLKSCPLWLAWYTDTSASVLIPNPWAEIFLWQFGTPAVGREYGVQSTEIDMNYINMTEADFQRRYGAALPQQPGGTMFYGRVNTSVLNVRQGPGASYMDLGDLLLNDHVIATEKVGGWWRLSAARRGSWTGADVALSGGKTVAQRAAESNDVWCSGAYVVEVDAPTEPPAPPPVDTFPAEIGVTIGTVTKQYVPKP